MLKTQVLGTTLDATGGASYTNRVYSNTDFQFRVNFNNGTSFDHGGNNRLILATGTTADAQGKTTGYIVESVFYAGDLKKLAGG